MSILGRLGVAARDAAELAAADRVAKEVVTLSRNVARRRLKEVSSAMNETQMQWIVATLDGIAKREQGEKAELAAELAEYAESLLQK
jgi:hypothetical protein